MPGFVNYKKGCTRLAAASDKVYQLLAHGRWFSPGTPASSTTKTGRHDMAEILLKVALNHQKSIKNHRFVDSGIIIDHHCLNFLFITFVRLFILLHDVHSIILYYINLLLRYEYSVGLAKLDKPEGVINSLKEPVWKYAGRNMEAVYNIKRGKYLESL